MASIVSPKGSMQMQSRPASALPSPCHPLVHATQTDPGNEAPLTEWHAAQIHTRLLLRVPVHAAAEPGQASEGREGDQITQPKICLILIVSCHCKMQPQVLQLRQACNVANCTLTDGTRLKGSQQLVHVEREGPKSLQLSVRCGAMVQGLQ